MTPLQQAGTSPSSKYQVAAPESLPRSSLQTEHLALRQKTTAAAVPDVISNQQMAGTRGLLLAIGALHLDDVSSAAVGESDPVCLDILPSKAPVAEYCYITCWRVSKTLPLVAKSVATTG